MAPRRLTPEQAQAFRLDMLKGPRGQFVSFLLLTQQGTTRTRQVLLVSALLGYHDDENNIHAVPRRALATRFGVDEKQISRAFTAGKGLAWLVQHSRGHKGHTAEFHYQTPSKPYMCPDPSCLSRQ